MEFNALYFCNAHRFNRDMKGFDQTREQCRTDEPELPEIDYAFLDAIAPHRSNTRLRSNQRARNLISAHRCCAVASNGTDRGTIVPPNANSDRGWQTVVRRCLDSVGWVVPSTILALLPKCPVCLAAYVAIGTGVGLSVSTATYLRAAIVILCLASLSCLAARHAQSLTAWTLKMTRRQIRIERTIDRTANHCEAQL
jgi:hypothetical protein